MQNWWDAFPDAENPAGGAAPIPGPPRLPTPQTPAQEALDEERLNNLRNPRPALPAGFRLKPDGTAERIPGIPETSGSEESQKMRQKMANLNALVEQINRVQELYEGNIAGQPASRLFGATEMFPTPANRQFDAASSGLAEQGLAAFRVPGVGAQSDTELRQFVQANKPTAADFDKTIEEKLLQLRNRVDATRKELGLTPAEWRAQQGLDETQQYYAPPTAGDQMELNDGSTGAKTINDPALAGVNARINSMLKAGAKRGEFISFLKAAKIPPREVMQSIDRALIWQKQNPNYRGDYNVNIDDTSVPLSNVEQLRSKAAMSPGGTYAVNAADALSLGNLDSLTENPELTRTTMDALAERNPNAALAGQVTGGLAVGGGIQGGLMKAGVGAGRAALAADALFGAGAGAGAADDGSRLLGAVKGAAAATAGGQIGGRLVSGTGSAISGVKNEAVRALADRGIPLTPGQIVGQGGLLGRAAKGIEDKLESVPLLGDAIRKRRLEGYEAMNQAAFTDALQPVGGKTAAIAEPGVEQAFDATTAAYRQALDGVTVNGNQQSFANALTAAINRGRNLPGETAENFDFVIREHVVPRFDLNGNITGSAFQDIRQALRAEQRDWKGKPRGREYGAVLKQVEASIESLFRSQAPDAVPLLNKADQAYRRTKVVADAVDKAKNKGGIFTPAQLGQAASRNARKYGGAGTTQQPFFDLQRQAQDVLPSEVPTSGSVDRALAAGILPAAVGGGAAAMDWIDPETAALIAALGLPYTKAGASAAQKMLVARPDLMRQIGAGVSKNKRIGGLLAAPVGVALANQ